MLTIAEKKFIADTLLHAPVLRYSSNSSSFFNTQTQMPDEERLWYRPVSNQLQRFNRNREHFRYVMKGGSF